MLLHYILSHLDDSKTETVRSIIVFISASPARIKLVHHLWVFSIPQGSQYGKFIYGLLYINKYCIISYATTTDIVWEQILPSTSRLVEFNNICGHPVQLERHITPIILNGSSSAEYINQKELQTAIEWQNLLLNVDAFSSNKWQSQGVIIYWLCASSVLSIAHDSPRRWPWRVQGTGFCKCSGWNSHVHKVNLRCLVDLVMPNVHGETKQVEHNMKYRTTITTGSCTLWRFL